MTNPAQMSESEMEVMRVLWDLADTATSAQVIEILGKTKAWKPSTVWTFLGRLVEKGFVYAEKKGKRSFYSPALSEEEYRQAQTRRFLETVHGGSVKSFFSALGGGKDLNSQELSELREWLKGTGGGE